jgi:aryl-alcohol dehydrogenase-like predicted oxidoreductase
LTGKYTEDHLEHQATDSAAGTRPGVIASSGNMTRRALGIADVVRSIATEIDATPAQVALAWVLQQPAVTSPIIGARTVSQAVQNLQALDVTLGDDHLARLDKASEPGAIFPGKFLARSMTKKLIFGATAIDFSRPAARVPF